jgi:hypothetical protein
MVYYQGTTIEKIGSWSWHTPRFLNQRHSHTNRTRSGRDFGAIFFCNEKSDDVGQIGNMQIIEHQENLPPDFNDDPSLKSVGKRVERNL